jgi:hypothetical protein
LSWVPTRMGQFYPASSPAGSLSRRGDMSATSKPRHDQDAASGSCCIHADLHETAAVPMRARVACARAVRGARRGSSARSCASPRARWRARQERGDFMPPHVLADGTAAGSCTRHPSPRQPRCLRRLRNA